MYEIQIIDCQNPKFDKDMSVRSFMITSESKITMRSSANSSLVLHSSYDAFTALMIADCISSFFFGDGAISIHYSTRHISSV